MREKLKKVLKYIFRGWGEDPPPYAFSFLPPIFLDLIGWAIIVAVVYGLGAYLWSII